MFHLNFSVIGIFTLFSHGSWMETWYLLWTNSAHVKTIFHYWSVSMKIYFLCTQTYYLHFQHYETFMFAIKNLVPAHCPVTFSPSPVLPTSHWRRIYFCTCICVVSNLVLPLAAYLGFLLFFKVIFKVTSCQELWSTLLIVVIYKFLLRCTDDLCSLFTVSYFVQVVTELPFLRIRGESRGGIVTHREQSWFAPYGQQSGKTAFAGGKAFAVLSGSLVAIEHWTWSGFLMQLRSSGFVVYMDLGTDDVW